jgi:hypothetical protein
MLLRKFLFHFALIKNSIIGKIKEKLDLTSYKKVFQIVMLIVNLNLAVVNFAL